MINFKTISYFRKRLKDLINYKRGVYGGAKTEVITAFKNVPIEQIRKNRDMILMQDDSIAIKLRLPDHRQRLSKKDGFRLVYFLLFTFKRAIIINWRISYSRQFPCLKQTLQVVSRLTKTC